MRRLPGVFVRFVAGVSVVAAFMAPPTAGAQDAPPKMKLSKADTAKKKPKAATDTTPKVEKLPDSPLFRSQSLMEVTFTVNIKAIRKDKGDKAPWHAATLSYADTSSQSGKRTVPVRARTRGIWRLKNCDFPPVRFNFVNKEAKGSVFHDLDEPKLVGYCKGMSNYEQYILQEFQLYRIYRLLTPISHQVRLLRMTYVDSATSKVEATKYAFIVEDPAHVAAAAGGKIMKVLGATSEDLDGDQATLAYLFQYMIGNTDFSFGGLHNAELVALPTGTNVPIAYDFDFAGAIDASYATPDTSLRITRVRDRQYRGFCQQNPLVPKVLQLFRDKKAAIYALYSDQIGALMAPKTVKETLEYFDAFYATIADQKEIERRILRDCRNPR
ncbi:MAG: hypothetical protein IPP90_06590 [Gemmatimonadaceae bacterium]|nr:hypothetical protein [Gemmatimonadaceae bacterium]